MRHGECEVALILCRRGVQVARLDHPDLTCRILAGEHSLLVDCDIGSVCPCLRRNVSDRGACQGRDQVDKMDTHIQQRTAACMLLVEHPAASVALITLDRADDESEREMLKPLRRKSRSGRQPRSPVAHTIDKRNTDVDAALFRQLPDPPNLLEIEAAGLLDQKRDTAIDEPLGQRRHLGMTAENQGEVEILFEEIVVRLVEPTIQLLRETRRPGKRCGIGNAHDIDTGISQRCEVERKMPMTDVEYCDLHRKLRDNARVEPLNPCRSRR